MKQRLEIEDILSYTFLSGLTVSPDGTKCAFVANRCDEASNGYRSCIYVLDCRTRQVKQMTTLGQERKVLWLDNDTILFPAMRDEELRQKVRQGEEWTCYYALSLHGGEATEYMRVPKRVLDIQVIDRDRFAMTADYDLDHRDPHALPEEERSAYLKERAEQKESYYVADELPFRNNGLGIHNGIRSALFVFDRRTGVVKKISEDAQNVDFFQVSRNRIIFSPKRFTKDQPKIFQGGISLYNADTGELRVNVDEVSYRIRYCGFMGETPVFVGSDGKRYYYQENPYFFYIDESDGKEHIFARNEDSAENTIGSDVRYGSNPHFAADKNRLCYLRTMDNHAHLMQVDERGAFSRITTQAGSVDGVVMCEGGFVIVAMRANRLQELYFLEEDGKETQLTFFNEWVQEARTLSSPEEVYFESDGRSLAGVVMEPVGHSKGEKAPCILYIHGGHKCAFGIAFYHEMQVWANRGFYVIFCNPRGSDGRDNEFFEITGKYGEWDYEDIMAFTDFCVQTFPDIDEERMGVGGGSYGGFMTNWVIGHTGRFRCAVSQRSISSWATMFVNSDTSYQFPMYQPDSDIWHNIGFYWDHSPLKYADRCKTPTLFIHSDEDYRCPLSEGVSMFNALKYNGVEARMCVFRGENHELSRSGKPKNRINRLKEMTAWFERFLK